MTRKGETLQRVVAALERTLNANDDVTVVSPKRLVDLTTKRGREHDVVVQFQRVHTRWTVALECRDRSRAIDVPQVEAFAKKCQRTGVDRGMIVSPRGFTKTALKVATSEKIVCLRLDEVEGFDWCLAPGMRLLSHTLLHTEFFADIGRKADAETKLFLSDGTPIDEATAKDIVVTEFKKHLDLSLPDGEHTIKWIDNNPACYAKDADGMRLSVPRMVFAARYRQTSNLVPFEFRSYVDAATGKKLSAAVSAHFEFRGRGLSLVVAEQQNGDKLVTLTARAEKSRTRKGD